LCYDDVLNLQRKFGCCFITKIINGKQTQEGLCFSCAKKQGIQPINQYWNKPAYPKKK